MCCSPVVLSPTADDAERGKARYNDITMEQLNKGYDLFLAKCGGCHTLYKPYDYSEEKWREVLPDMCRRAKLDQAQSDLITKYVLTKREGPIIHKKDLKKQ